MNLARIAARGGAASYGAQAAKLVIQLITTAVLARLLNPSDFGLSALAAVVGGLALLVANGGLSQAAVQAETITTQQRSNLFWANAGLGLLIAGAIAAGSPLAASVFRQPELTSILRVAAISYLLGALAAQFTASLTRDLRFASIAAAEVAAQGIASACAIVLAFSGVGYWALIVQQVVQSLVLLLVMVVATRWLPALPRRTGSMQSLLRYGAQTLGVQAINYASESADTIALGVTVGPAQLGYYNRAATLAKLPMQQIGPPTTRVAFPLLSRLAGSPGYDPFLRKGAMVTGYGIGLALVCLSALAPQVVAVYLGPGWEEAHIPAMILGVAAIFQLVNYPHYWVFVSRGKTGLQLKYTIVSRSAMVASVVVGAMHGTVGAAMAVAVSMALHFAIMAGLAIPRTGIDYRALRIVQGRVLLFLAANWAAAYLAGGWASRSVGPWTTIAIGIAASLLVSTTMFLTITALRRDGQLLVDIVRSLPRREVE